MTLLTLNTPNSFDTLPAQKHLTKYEKLNLIKVLGTLEYSIPCSPQFYKFIS